jgi:imidazole glycerol-phosphate synthase subunit HisF
MLRRRVIPCLDVRGGRLVKGVRFQELRDCGDPVEAAAAYAAEGADEIVWLNISAGDEDWRALLDAVSRAAERVDVPLTVGGGVRSPDQARDLLLAGADKVSCNTAALDRPALVDELADRFGSQCVVVAVDAHRDGRGGWLARAAAGSRDTGRDALRWMDEATGRGAGELLLTSIDADGTGGGYDLELIERTCERVDVPVVASGGAGGPGHMVRALLAGAQAALAASIFHDRRYAMEDVKREASQAGLPVRL